MISGWYVFLGPVLSSPTLYAKILGVNPIKPRAARFFLYAAPYRTLFAACRHLVVFYSRCEFRTAYTHFIIGRTKKSMLKALAEVAADDTTYAPGGGSQSVFFFPRI